MAEKAPLGRSDWLAVALRALERHGIEGVHVVALAKALGVSRGSFYWHFRNRSELLDGVLAYWDRELTDIVIEHISRFEGTPTQRIWELMDFIVERKLGRFDPAIRAWALYDRRAAAVVRRVDRKRLDTVRRLFLDAGFSAQEADARSRMLVVYLSGDPVVFAREPAAKRRKLLRLRHRLLTTPLPRTKPRASR